MGSTSGGSSSKSKTYIRYAGYVEENHEEFLNAVAAFRVGATGRSPFADYNSDFLESQNTLFESAFFGAGYYISSFPSLYDMYGKFMAGLDIDSLYDQMFEDTVNAPEVSNLVSAEAALYDDDINTNVLPRFLAGMRDINAVQSSSFVIGRSIIEDSRVKAVSKFSAELKYKLIPVATERWKAHLEWNKGVVLTYAELTKLYFAAKMDVVGFNYEMAVKDILWPFTVLDYERAALGALQGAAKTTSDVAGSSTAGKAIGGALGGAAAGAMMTPGAPLVGGAIGGVLGLASSFF